MKKFLRVEDILVFSICIISFIWVCLYQLLWINEDSTKLLFKNADVWGSITYTVFTSVLASGIFYAFTIFLPRYMLFRRYKGEIRDLALNVENILFIIVGNIKNEDTNNYYNYYDFHIQLNKSLVKAKREFINSYKEKNDYQYFMDLYSYEIEIFKHLQSTYHKILPSKLMHIISGLTTYDYYTLKMRARSGDDYIEKQFFSVICIIIRLNYDLRVLTK